MAQPWTSYERFVGISEPDCDRPEHGFDCRHLAGRDEQGNVVDEVLDKLHADLEEAEEDLQGAESAIEDAEAHRDHCEERVRDIEEAIRKHKQPVKFVKASAA